MGIDEASYLRFPRCRVRSGVLTRLGCADVAERMDSSRDSRISGADASREGPPGN